MFVFISQRERERSLWTLKKIKKFNLCMHERGDVMFCHDMINWAFNGLMMVAQLIEERLRSPKFYCFPWMWVKLPRTTLFSDSQLDKRSSLLSLVSKKVLRNCPWVNIYIYKMGLHSIKCTQQVHIIQAFTLLFNINTY